MKFRIPDYYDDFQCLARKCRDNCCVGWEIEVDEETAAYYETLNTAFSVIVRKYTEGGYIHMKPSGRCPFLNGNNLCDIITRLGKENICQICRDHPRFFSWYGRVKEGGLGLCCEAAARLILSRDMNLIEREIDEDPFDPPYQDLLEMLEDDRKILFKCLRENEFPKAMRLILDFADQRQSRFDVDKWNQVNIMSETVAIKPAHPDEIIQFFINLEPMSRDWRIHLQDYLFLFDKIDDIPKEDYTELRRVAEYFLYRYYLKTVDDIEDLCRVKAAVICTWLLSLVWRGRRITRKKLSFEDKALTAAALSKEIEYNLENLATLYDATYELDCFSTEELKGLFI